MLSLAGEKSSRHDANWQWIFRGGGIGLGTYLALAEALPHISRRFCLPAAGMLFVTVDGEWPQRSGTYRGDALAEVPGSESLMMNHSGSES